MKTGFSAHARFNWDNETNTFKGGGDLTEKEGKGENGGFNRSPFIMLSEKNDDRDKANKESKICGQTEGAEKSDAGEHGKGGEDRQRYKDEERDWDCGLETGREHVVDGGTEKDEVANAVTELSDNKSKIDEGFHGFTANIACNITIGGRLGMLGIGLLL